jgi:hypothetical protein
VFKKVAKKLLKSNENIVFGKIDGTANDLGPILRNSFSAENLKDTFYPQILYKFSSLITDLNLSNC